MLDNTTFTKSCKDDAERAVCLYMLSKVPEEREDAFAILHDAADRMDDEDVLTSVDKVALALVNCVDADVITVGKAEWVKEMKNRLFDIGGPIESGDISADIDFFDVEAIRRDLEESYKDDPTSIGYYEEGEDVPETLYDAIRQQYGSREVDFDEYDSKALVAFLADKGYVSFSTLEENFKADEYAMAFLTIDGSLLFGPEVYEKDGTVLTTPNFNYERPSGVCMAAETLVYAIRDGEGIAEHRAELDNQLKMVGIEPSTEMEHGTPPIDENMETPQEEGNRQSLDDLVKAAEEFFTYPEGFTPPEHDRNPESR